MVILAAVKQNIWVAVIAATTLIFGASYTLWMVKRVFYGAIANDHVAALKDLSAREFSLLAILAICVIGLGVYPEPLTALMQSTSEQFLDHMAISKLPAVGM